MCAAPLTNANQHQLYVCRSTPPTNSDLASALQFCCSLQQELLLLVLQACLRQGQLLLGRCKIRTGSFSAMSIIEALSPGLMLADLVSVIASLDVVAPEVDR